MSDLFNADVDAIQSMVYNPLDRTTFLEKVEVEGKTAVFPKSNELQIDIDSKEQYKVFEANFHRFLQYHNYGGAVDQTETVSASGKPHCHITLTVEGAEFTEWERIALQACLGSDPVRELFSALRLMHDVEHPTMFVEAK